MQEKGEEDGKRTTKKKNPQNLDLYISYRPILCVWQKAEFCFIGDMKPRVVGQFSAVKVGNEAERAVGSTIVQQNETCNAFQYRIGKTQCARCSALEGGDCAGSAKLGNAARCC